MVQFAIVTSEGSSFFVGNELVAKQTAVKIHNDDPSISVIVYKVFKSGKRRQIFSK